MADAREFEPGLGPSEHVLVHVPVDGFFASEHNVLAASHVVMTNRRYIVFAERGVLRKRYEEAASWGLGDFTPRMNSNQGAALGPFLYLLTLFTQGGETVSAGF